MCFITTGTVWNNTKGVDKRSVDKRETILENMNTLNISALLRTEQQFSVQQINLQYFQTYIIHHKKKVRVYFRINTDCDCTIQKLDRYIRYKSFY